jgi:hypothetical protein
MPNYKNGYDIDKLKEEISNARNNLLRIQNDFKDEPELLNVYEPSALYLLNKLEEMSETIDSL